MAGGLSWRTFKCRLTSCPLFLPRSLAQLLLSPYVALTVTIFRPLSELS
jgi:hypothetical protein